MSVVWKTVIKVLKDNAVCRIIFILECCVLLIMTANCLRPRCDYSFTSDNLYTPSGLGDWITDESGTGYQVASSDTLGDNILINTDFFALYPGSYNIKVLYESQVSYLEGVDYTVGTGLLNLNSSHNEVYYHFDSMLLRDGLNSVEQTLQVTSPWKISDFQITLNYSGQGSLTVYSIEITENVMYKYLSLLGIFALFMFLDIFCFLMFMESGNAHKKELGLVTLIIIVSCLPFLADWMIVGEDSAFWAARIRLIAEAFREEWQVSSVQSFLIDSSGYTALEMYGSLFLYLPAFLFYCGFSLTFVYNFYICSVTILTCLITYFSGLSVFGKSNPALLAAAIYTLSVPRLTSILTLSSLGEMTAMAFFPLVLAGFYRIYSASAGEKIQFSAGVSITLGLGGILCSYVPAFWMTCFLMFLCCVKLIRRTVQLKRFIALLKTAILTGILILLTILGGWTSLKGVLPEGNPDARDPVISLFLSIGFSVIFGLLLFVIYIIRKGWGSKDLKQNDTCFAAFCWGMAVLTIFLSGLYVFYDFLDFLPGQLLSVLSGYCSPSGWLPFTILFGVFCTCEIADSTELREVFCGVPVILLLCMALTIDTGQIYSDQMRTSSMERLSNNLYENLDNFGATEPYITYLSEDES